MAPVTLDPAALETFYGESVDFAELLRLVELDLSRGAPTDWPSIDQAQSLIKLCIETLLKYRLTSRQLATFDVLSTFGEDNSHQVCDYVTTVHCDIDEDGMGMFKHQVKTIQLLVCTMLVYMRATTGRNIVEWLHAEYQTILHR